MANVPQSHEELEKNLKDIFEFLVRSAQAYDNGFENEAKRMALSLRILLHDTRNSHSLLGQLNKKNIKYLDTAGEYSETNLATYHGLTMLSLSMKGAEHLPLLDDSPTPCGTKQFDEWWDSVIIKDKDKNTISRKGIILTVANMDGGAHVDPTLDSVYANLKNNNSLNWNFVGGDGVEVPILGAELATIRQIAHEVLKTHVKEYSPENVNRPKENILSNAQVIETDSQPTSKDKVGRNDPCPCGSGKKYKKCHGKNK